MPIIAKEVTEKLEALPPEVLQKIVVGLIKMSKENFDYVNVNYIHKEIADDDLFENVKETILIEIESIGYSRARVVQKEIATVISGLIKEINHYKKIAKNKKREAELLLLLLNEIFDRYTHELGTCWTVFDSKVAIITNRLINLVTKKIHEDYFVEYEDTINHFLGILHEQCNGINYVFRMPKQIIKR